MADDPKVSSQPEPQELPTPEFSEKGDSSTSTDADVIVSKLTPILEKIVEQKVQSVKDKRFSEIERVLGGRSKVLAELKELGQSVPDNVLSELRLREIEERLSQSPAQPVQAGVDGSTPQKTAATEAIAELKENGLSENDPAFIELLRGRYSSRAEFDLKVQRYINGKLKPQKPASVADVVQGPAGSPPAKPDAQVLIAKLQGYQKFPTRYGKEIEETVKQLEAINWGK